MNVDPKDALDHHIDEALASMVGGEPRGVIAASVRQAIEERRSSRPAWLALAAVLVVALGVALKDRAPVGQPPVPVARSAEAPAPDEARPAPSANPTPAAAVAASPTSRRVRVQGATGGPYEGLPRLTIALIDLPEPLSAGVIDAGPIQIPRIEIAPLSISSLSNEQEHK